VGESSDGKKTSKIVSSSGGQNLARSGQTTRNLTGRSVRRGGGLPKYEAEFECPGIQKGLVRERERREIGGEIKKNFVGLQPW